MGLNYLFSITFYKLNWCSMSNVISTNAVYFSWLVRYTYIVKLLPILISSQVPHKMQDVM